MKTSNITRLDREICATVWTSPHPQAIVETLSYDFGPRPPGTKAMRQAQSYLGDLLRKLGPHNVHSEPVPVFAWREAPSRLELVAPRARGYESFHCVHSASGNLTAPLVDGQSATEECLDRLGRLLEGAIVLIHGHQISGSKYIPLPQQIHNLSSRGAVGALIHSLYPLGCPAIELAGVWKDAAIPVLGISNEDGYELASVARNNRPKIRIVAAGESYRTQCANLVAELGPDRSASEVIVLSAHLDTFYVNPGSLDNLTGIVTLIEVARALAPLQSKFKRTLRLIVFTGEEYGFLGSKSYVHSHAKELDRVRFVLNMDTLFPATAEGVAVMWSPAMRDHIDEAFRTTQCRMDVRNLFCMSSDYLPFMLAGIPAARPADWKNSLSPWSHTRLDTPDKIPAQWMRLNAMTYAQLLLRLLADPRPFPASRKSSEEVRALLAQEDAVEALRFFDFDVYTLQPTNSAIRCVRWA